MLSRLVPFLLSRPVHAGNTCTLPALVFRGGACLAEMIVHHVTADGNGTAGGNLRGGSLSYASARISGKVKYPVDAISSGNVDRGTAASCICYLALHSSLFGWCSAFGL